MSDPRRFAEIIRREHDGMHQLGAVLAEEFACLGRNDAEALDAVMQRKATLLDDLQRVATERDATLRAAGVAVSRDAVERWLQSTGHGIGEWHALLARTRDIQNQHRLNQTLLESLLRHNQRSLDLLMQMANPDLTYGADGSTSGSLGPRSRGSA